MEKKKVKSWPVIILLIILFFPVGIWFLVERLKIKDKTVDREKRYFKWFGYFFLFGTLIMGIELIRNDFESEFLQPVVGYLGLSILFLYLYKKNKKIIIREEKYLNIINSNEFSIENIASAMSLSIDQVKKDLYLMIKKGIILDSYIDESRNIIVVSKKENYKYKDSSEEKIFEEKVESKTIYVNCKSCGASNKFNGSNEEECEYCGTSLAEFSKN